MPRLRDNVLANYAGQAWVAIMGLAFVPLYLRALGSEQFGLVAFMLSLQAISLVLDLGVGVFLGRELAQRAHDPARTGSIRRLVRSFEWVVWPTAGLIAAAIIVASGAIATHWLNPRQLGPAETTSAVQVMGLAVAMLWPTSFYAAALSGLEHQRRLNVIVAIFATLRFAGVLPVLYYTGAGLHGFLWWYALVGGAQSLCSAIALWRVLPPATQSPRFEVGELLGARRFALGVFVVTASALVLGQVDRLALSALRPLQELGYYGVALAVSGGLGRLVQPMFYAIYPRLSRFAARDAEAEAETSALYHLASQIVATVVAAIAGVICVHSESLLWLWTGDAALSTQVALPLSVLFAGAAINGMMTAPYALQLAHGWTRLAARSNLVALLVAIPACIAAIRWHGMLGAASVWLALNIGYLLLVVPLMHRRLLRGESARWYRNILMPALAATGTALLAKWLWPDVERTVAGFAWMGAVCVAAAVAAVLASPGVRSLLLRYLHPRSAP